MTHRVPTDALGAGAAGIDGGIDGQKRHITSVFLEGGALARAHTAFEHVLARYMTGALPEGKPRRR